MNVLTIYSLLLLCAMSPLLCATSHGGVCPEGSYCPAGTDCSNSSFCEAGVCSVTTRDTCITEVSLAFASASYTFDEDSGTVQLELTLDGAIDCCSVSVTVKAEDVTAKGGEDYKLSDDQYTIVTFSAGQTRAFFDVTILEDEEIEDTETFRVSIFELSVPYGVNLGFDTFTEVDITDDDNAILSFGKSTFYVKENEGPVEPELVLNVPVSFSITVQVNTQNGNLSEECDRFSASSIEVIILNGTTRQTFPINITNDDVYEGDESFTLEIQDSLPNLVTLDQTSSTATVVIQEDEDKIIANFDKKVYEVQEHQGIVSPVIELSKPSPCCFILRAQLMNVTAHGRTIDYGYAIPKIYNYTFHAGSTCASADANITITDDTIKEDTEAFKISIIDYTLPFGVKAGAPATIKINDNDNCVSFQYDEYTVSEDERRVYLRINLDKPATNDRVIPVDVYLDVDATEGADYDSGPYNVSFKKGDTYKYFYITIIDDDIFEGEEEFIVSLDQLPDGIVPCSPSTAIIKIIDDEYEVCFKSLDYDVVEGDSVELTLTLSRPLPTPLTVQLEYLSQSAKLNSDYYTPPRSVRFNAGSNETSFTIRTREDSIQEEKNEFFDVTATYTSKPNNTYCDIAFVNIVDDDDITISFDRGEYRGTKASPAKPRLKLNKAPTSSFTVIIEQRDGTAKGGDDYKLRRISVKFDKGGSTYANLQPVFINDEIVECDECYYLDIVTDTLPSRVTAVNPTTAKICIIDDDKSIVTREGNLLKFSKAIDVDTEVIVTYYNAPRTVTLTLKAGDKEIIVDTSRPIQRITIVADCCLDRNDFTISATRTYLTFSRC